MLVFTPDLIKHVFPRGLTVGDNRRLWSLIVIKLTNSVNFTPISVGSVCTNYIKDRFSIFIPIE